MSDTYQPRHAEHAPRHAAGMHPDEARVLDAYYAPRHAPTPEPVRVLNDMSFPPDIRLLPYGRLPWDGTP